MAGEKREGSMICTSVKQIVPDSVVGTVMFRGRLLRICTVSLIFNSPLSLSKVDMQ